MQRHYLAKRTQAPAMAVLFAACEDEKLSRTYPWLRRPVALMNTHIVSPTNATCESPDDIHVDMASQISYPYLQSLWSKLVRVHIVRVMAGSAQAVLNHAHGLQLQMIECAAQQSNVRVGA
jgi:hypothetical protein